MDGAVHGVYGGIVIVREVGSRKKEREAEGRGFVFWLNG